MYTAGSTSKFSFSRSRRYLVRILVASSTCWSDRPRFSRANRRVLPISIPVCALPDSPPLLDDGLGQDPEACHGVEDHEDEHRQLALQDASRVAQEAKRDRVCKIYG